MSKWSVLLCVLLAACQPPATTAKPEPKKKAPASDPEFSCKRSFWARSYVLESRLDPGPAAGFAQLTDSQKQVLDRLLRRSVLRHSLQVADGRMLVTMPRLLSPPRTRPHQLLIAEDLDRLVLFDPQKKLRYSLPRRRLPDVLDGWYRSRRTSFKLELGDEAAPSAVSPGPPEGLRTAAVRARLSLEFFPDHKTHRKHLLEQYLVALVADEPRGLPLALPVLTMALPLLQHPQGDGVLESLSQALGRPPLAWSITTVSEASSTPSPPAVVTTVVDQGHVRIPRCALSTVRKDFRDARTLPRPQRRGLQLVSAADLAGLRATKAGGALVVQNRSQSLAHLYVDGLLLGWVTAGGGRMSFTGLPAGYYRIYARSPLGIRSWGPRDIYVPGPITLR